MKIPVFVSCPTLLNSEQQKSKQKILDHLEQMDMEPRALGKSDYPDEYPLKEIYIIARHCSGAVILGFEQFRSERGIKSPGTEKERIIESPVPFPTPWNHIEAGILFALKIPLLIFREPGIKEGIFDKGVTDVYTHNMPKGILKVDETFALDDIFRKWQTKVYNHYRDF